MGRPRKHPRKWYRATDTFAGNHPDTGEPYAYQAGDIVPEDEVKRLGTMFFESLDKLPKEVTSGTEASHPRSATG